MSHPAASSLTTQAPRRRTHRPAAWERAGGLSGALGAIALVAAAGILASTPSVDAAPSTVRVHLHDNTTLLTTTGYATVVAALLLVPFLASLRTFTAHRAGAAQWRWTVTLVAGAIGIVMVALAGSLLATASLLARGSSSDDAVFAVFVAAKLVATLALLPVAALVLANARAIATRRRQPERWLVRFDIEIATFAVLASTASFVANEWLGPGETVTAAAWLLVALWIVALARTIARGDRPETSEETP